MIIIHVLLPYVQFKGGPRSIFTPTLQKPEGFRVKALEGEVVVLYFESSATQNLKSSGFPDVLGRLVGSRLGERSLKLKAKPKG